MKVAKSYLLSFTPFFVPGKSYLFKFHILKPMSLMNTEFNMDYWLFSQYNAKELLSTERAMRVYKKRGKQGFSLEGGGVVRLALPPNMIELGIDIPILEGVLDIEHYCLNYARNAELMYPSLALVFKPVERIEVCTQADLVYSASIDTLISSNKFIDTILAECQDLTNGTWKQIVITTDLQHLLTADTFYKAEKQNFTEAQVMNPALIGGGQVFDLNPREAVSAVQNQEARSEHITEGGILIPEGVQPAEPTMRFESIEPAQAVSYKEFDAENTSFKPSLIQRVFNGAIGFFTTFNHKKPWDGELQRTTDVEGNKYQEVELATQAEIQDLINTSVILPRIEVERLLTIPIVAPVLESEIQELLETSVILPKIEIQKLLDVQRPSVYPEAEITSFIDIEGESVGEGVVEKLLNTSSITPEAEIEKSKEGDVITPQTEIQVLYNAEKMVGGAAEITKLTETPLCIAGEAEVQDYVNAINQGMGIAEVFRLSNVDKIIKITGEVGFLDSAIRAADTVSDGVLAVLDVTKIVGSIGEVQNIHTIEVVGRFNNPIEIESLGSAKVSKVLEGAVNPIETSKVTDVFNGQGEVFDSSEVERIYEGAKESPEVSQVERIYEGAKEGPDVSKFTRINNGVNEPPNVAEFKLIKEGRLDIQKDKCDVHLYNAVLTFGTDRFVFGKVEAIVEPKKEETAILVERDGVFTLITDKADLHYHPGKLYIDVNEAELLDLVDGRLFEDPDEADLAVRVGIGDDVHWSDLAPRPGVELPGFDHADITVLPFVLNAPEEMTTSREFDAVSNKPEESTLIERIYDGTSQELEEGVVPERIYDGESIEEFDESVVSLRSRIFEAVYTRLSSFFKRKKRMRIDDEGYPSGPPKPPPQPTKKIWLIEGKAQSWHLWPRRKTR